MSFLPFMQLFPDIGPRETRVIALLDDKEGSILDKEGRLPADRYALVEHYCVDPKCDCRRVLLQVVSETTRKPVCTISFGFDPHDKMRGPFIDPHNPRNEFAEELLELVEQMVLPSRDYVARLQRHYQMVKQRGGGRLRFDFRLATPGEVAARIAERKQRQKARKKVLAQRRPRAR